MTREFPSTKDPSTAFPFIDKSEKDIEHLYQKNTASKRDGCFYLLAFVVFNALAFAMFAHSRSSSPSHGSLPSHFTELSRTADLSTVVISNRFTTRPPVPRNPRPEEKFLAYLPHSGFHNQRIELENAILLAYYLKRTLIVPPCFLGPPMQWLRYDRLYSRLTLQTKHGLEHCPHLPPKIEDPLCANYTQWTQVSWEYVFNFDLLLPYVEFVHRDDVKEGWLKEHLGIAPDEISFVKDRTLYEYRIDDSPHGVTPVEKYRTRLDAAELLKIPSRLLHFGSLFGSGRVASELAEHATFTQLIRSTLIYSNPRLIAAADRIVEKLGGLAQYVGVHLRVGDGAFRSRKMRNVNTAVAKLNKMLLKEAGQSTARAPAVASESTVLAGFELHAAFAKGKRKLSLNECLSRGKTETVLFSPVLFLATDARYPENEPAFSQLVNRWPCLFTLSDFSDEITEIKDEINDFDKTSLAKYLIPMLDSVIAAKGRLFVGTARSTFSLFVKRLHEEYTRDAVAPIPDIEEDSVQDEPSESNGLDPVS